MFEFFARNHKLAQVFTLMALIVGLYAINNIQKERFPNVDFEVVQVLTTLPNSSPGDVESGITDKIEDILKDVDGIEKFSSTSKAGLSSIVIRLDQDAKNIDKVKQDIKTTIAGISDLDENANAPKIIEIETSKMEILRINLASDLPYLQLQNIFTTLKDKLELVDGVAEIDSSGETDDEVKIFLNPQKLSLYKLSLNQVLATIKNRNYRYTAGDDNKITGGANIVVLAKFKSIQDLENLVLKSGFDKKEVLLKDVATITYGLKDKESITRVDGLEGFVLKIRKRANADIITTVDKVKTEVSNFKQELKNKQNSVKIFYTHDLSKDVRNRLDIVKNNGIMGFIGILIVLGVFLSIRTAFWVAVGMSVSLLGTVALMLFFGETINLISLAAIVLVLGIVVDDSIIIAESIQQEREKDNSFAAVVRGYKKVIKPVITTILTSILAISSMFLMEGTMGKFIYAIPMVVIFALIFSLLEVSIALPAHIGSGSIPKPRVWFKKIENVFLRWITKILKFRYLVVLLFFVLAIATTIFAKKYTEFNLFPAKGSTTIKATLETSVNGSLQYASDVSLKVEKVISKMVGADLEFVGSEITKTGAKIEISLTPINDRKTKAVDIMESLKAETQNIVGVEALNFSIRRPGPPAGRDIELQIIGKNDAIRSKVAKIIYQKLQNTSGVSDIDRNDKDGKKRLEVVFDFNKMAKFGVNFIDVKNYLSAAFSGVEVISNRKNGKDVSYKVFVGNGKIYIDNLSEIKIANNSGRLINFTDFSKVQKLNGEGDINHFNGVRTIKISASIDDKITTGLKVVESVKNDLDIENNYPQIRLKSDGGAKESKKSMNSFKDAFLMSVIGIFFILMLLFNSYTQPLMVLTIVPFSLIGVVWAFYFHNEPISFFTIMGALALIGVIVNDALVMTSHLNDVKNENKSNSNLINWVARGATDRLRAVVLTSITTLAGVMPLAYGLGGVDFLIQPMVLALGYGLLFGTVVTLILLPCLYVINFEIVRKFAKNTIKN